MKTGKERTDAERIQWRIRMLWLLLAAMLALMIAAGEMGLGDSRLMTPLAETVSRIIFFGGIAWIAVQLVRNHRLIRNPEQLKQKMDEERSRPAQLRTANTVWKVLFGCLLAATLLAALAWMPAFPASLGIVCAFAAMRLLGRLMVRYWSNRRTGS